VWKSGSWFIFQVYDSKWSREARERSPKSIRSFCPQSPPKQKARKRLQKFILTKVHQTWRRMGEEVGFNQWRQSFWTGITTRPADLHELSTNGIWYVRRFWSWRCSPLIDKICSSGVELLLEERYRLVQTMRNENFHTMTSGLDVLEWCDGLEESE